MSKEQSYHTMPEKVRELQRLLYTRLSEPDHMTLADGSHARVIKDDDGATLRVLADEGYEFTFQLHNTVRGIKLTGDPSCDRPDIRLPSRSR